MEPGDLVAQNLAKLAALRISPLDLIPRRNLVEKVIEISLLGPPAGPSSATNGIEELVRAINATNTNDVRVVVFGGGTGLSNIIGGDSRKENWPLAPFSGLKEIFPKTRSVVCVTDDGGSTGALLQQLPLIALGDLRHVLVSSIQRAELQNRYGLSETEAMRTAFVLHGLFNHRFTISPRSATGLFSSVPVELQVLPTHMRMALTNLVESLFADPRLRHTLNVPHCLGNLLLAAAIYQQLEGEGPAGDREIIHGLQGLAELIGASPSAVLPCTTMPAQLKILYANGVLVTGEKKSSLARRGYPVDRIAVDFAGPPHMPPEVLESVAAAEMIIFAPGSLYTSIVPILQMPGLAEAIRANQKAVKVLVTNLWVQKGETDITRDAPERRFYVSDLIMAYHRNIPGGVKDLFQEVLAVSLQDIPGSILQRYAMEDKIPIYLDRGKVVQLGFEPVEAMIFSQTALRERYIVQHDPQAMAKAFQAIWATREHRSNNFCSSLPSTLFPSGPMITLDRGTPFGRMMCLRQRLRNLAISEELHTPLLEILWRHRDIPCEHLDYIKGIARIEPENWPRSQEWDTIFSFYDPDDAMIKIRADIYTVRERFEIAFLVALGQSLLGNYAAKKEVLPVIIDNEYVGKVFQLTLRPAEDRLSFFSTEGLDTYLGLTRMHRAKNNDLVYRRLINATEGFTPPGLLFGLIYMWYLDNRFAPHIEYKMDIMKNRPSNLVHEQGRVVTRRHALVNFFREQVFRHSVSGI